MKNFSLKIFTVTYQVLYVDKIDCEEGKFLFGDCDTVSRIIRIATKNLKGEKLSKEDLQLTLYHEIMHAICAEGEYGGINTDEPFIEWSAKCLFDLKEQKVI